MSLLVLLTGTEWSSSISNASSHTAAFRNSQLQTAGKWIGTGDLDAARQYSDLVQETQTRSSSLHSPRIPGRFKYLAALDEAVHQALDGKDSKTCLQEAADKWREITKDIGITEQTKAYSRSLGIEE